MLSEPSSPEFHIERVPVDGDVPSVLERLGLPASAAVRWARYAGPLLRTVLVAHTGTGIAGAAIAVSRPLASYLKVGGVWIGDQACDPGETERALVAHAEELAWEAGHIVVKRELAPADAQGRALSLPGYVDVQVPVIAAPIPDPVPPVPGGQFRWRSPSVRSAVPYMRQTTDFTCGTASLSMVLAHFGLIESASRATELDLWRQATTVMACDPYGLAVTAARRGLRPSVTVSTESALFLECLPTEQDRDLRRFIQDDFRRVAEQAGIDSQLRTFQISELRDVVAAGGLAIVLVDELLVHGQVCPHWILVHGLEGEYFIAHDPWTEVSKGESWLDGYDVPLSAAALDQLAWTGEPAYRAMLTFSR